MDAPKRTNLAQTILVCAICTWLAVQIVVPMRNWWMPGNVAWNEVGHRFSWRMKLRSKRGVAKFVITDSSGKSWIEHPKDHLTHSQHWKMRCIPDMIWQFAQFIAEYHRARGSDVQSVTADVMCSLNGREPARLINPDVDLLTINRDHSPVEWLLPLNVPLIANAD